MVYDITYTSIGAAVVEDFYDENVVFLRFCFEKELLKKNPLDRQGRILRMVYINQDLTNTGKYLFPELLDKFLAFFSIGKEKTQSGNHAESVVHRAGEGVPQPDGGIRRTAPMFEEFYEMYEPEERKWSLLINRCIGGRI